MKEKDERITRTEGAKLLGISLVGFDKKMRRHGVSKDGQKTYSKAKILLAKAEGMERDKSKLEEMVAEDESLTAQKTKKQIEKLAVEIERLRDERDVVRGKLADVDEVTNFWTRIYSDMIITVKTWRESETAKNPKLRKEIHAIADSLQTAMTDVLREHDK